MYVTLFVMLGIVFILLVVSNDKRIDMKYNLETSLIAKRNDKDINLLLESTNNINNYMDSLLAILVMKHLPLINNIDESIKDEKIILIYEDDLKNAKVRFVEEKGVVYINVTPFTKKKELKVFNVLFLCIL